jgi:geranylgeranyl diphosphate synthase, type II
MNHQSLSKMFDRSAYIERNNERIDQTLDVLLDRSQQGGRLVEAMRYSLMAGGKRLRPNLCIAAAEAVGGNPQDALAAACALEMIHTYSLIHDDLPAMDDDELRRGKPTCHIAFDEATAILAGDALLTMAFEVFASLPGCRPECSLKVTRMVAVAAGSRGMVQGQMLDMLSQGAQLTAEELEQLHSLKTGALIEASLAVGALVGDGSPEQIEALRTYGRRVGLAFQVVDDILNVEGDPAVMGKAAGTDQLRLKNSYPALLGLEKSRKFAQDLVQQAIAAISGFDAKAVPLRAIAGFVVERKK